MAWKKVVTESTTDTIAQDTGGNAATATALATARSIGGTSFDGTGDIAITTNANLTGDVTSSGNASTIKDDVALGGAPTAATATVGTNTTQLATTAFAVAQAAAGDISLASAKIWIGSGLGAKAELALSGDVTMLNTGVVTIGNEKIDSDHYVDGSIDNAHLADDAVDSDELAAGAVDTAHIADDQVTYAKMQNVTKDERLLGNISGDNSVITELDQGAILSFLGSSEAGATADQTAAEMGTLFAADSTAVSFGGDVTVTGDLTVSGDTTTVNVGTITVEDKNIQVADGAASLALASGAGLSVNHAITGTAKPELQWIDAGNTLTGWSINDNNDTAHHEIAVMNFSTGDASGDGAGIGTFHYDTSGKNLWLRTE